MTTNIICFFIFLYALSMQEAVKNYNTMPRASHKLKYIVQNDIPTKSQIQRNLGISLAQIFFDYSHHETIKLLENTMEVSQQPYGIVQSEKSTVLAWPEKKEMLKLSVHRDILALGEDVLKEFQIKIETLMRKKLRKEYTGKCSILEAQNRLALAQNSEQIHARYEDYIKSVQHDLEEKLQVIWADVNDKHNEELQKSIVRTRINTTYDVLRRMRFEMRYIITCLHHDFELSYYAQREKLIADFNEIMRKQYVKFNVQIKEIEKQKMEELRIQHHRLEIENATDIIYVLCMERLRNNSQMHALHKHFEEKIKILQELIVERDKNINEMEERLTECSTKNTKLEEKIAAITNEFKQFVNFVFNTVPGQSDFLLPPDLLFSINNTKKKDNGLEKKDD